MPGLRLKKAIIRLAAITAAVTFSCVRSDNVAVAQGSPEIEWISTGHMWPDTIYQLDISKDARFLASSSWTVFQPASSRTLLWNLPSGDCVIGRDLPGGYAVAFSPDNRMLAIGGTGVSIWQIPGSMQIRGLQTFGDTVRAVAFTSDNQNLAAGCQSGLIYLFRIADGTLLRTFHGHTNWVNSIALSRFGTTLLSASRDGTIRSWDANTGLQTGIKTNGNPSVNALAYSPNETSFVSGHSDRTVRIWQSSNLELINSVKTSNDLSSIISVAFSPDAELIAAGGRGLIELRRVPELTLVDTFISDSPDSFVRSVRFGYDGKTLYSAGDDRIITAWNLSDHTRRDISEQTYGVSAGAFSRDGSLVAIGSGSGAVQLREVVGKRLRAVVKSNSFGVFALAFSPTADLLAIGKGDSPIQIWNVATTNLQSTLIGHTSLVGSLAFSPDGSFLVSGSYDTSVRIWSVAQGALMQILDGHTNSVESVAVSADGLLVASASSDGVRLWRFQDGAFALLRVLSPPSCPVSPCTISSLAISREGFLGAVGGNAHLWIWRLADGSLVTDRRAAGFRLGFSPDGKLVVTLGDSDCDFVGSGGWNLMRHFDQNVSSSRFVVFSPDGSRFAYGSSSFVLARVPTLRISSIAITNTLVEINWTTFGGPYQLQRASNLTNGIWENLGSPTPQTKATNSIGNGPAFYRIIGLSD